MDAGCSCNFVVLAIISELVNLVLLMVVWVFSRSKSASLFSLRITSGRGGRPVKTFRADVGVVRYARAMVIRNGRWMERRVELCFLVSELPHMPEAYVMMVSMEVLYHIFRRFE